MSILFHHYKELKECISEVERTEEAGRVANTNSSKKEVWLTKKKEEEKQEGQEEAPSTLDSCFIKNKIAES
jgi:hypothetical protein